MTSLQTFFLESSNYFRTLTESNFLEVRNSGLQTCNERGKATVFYLEFSKFYNIPFFGGLPEMYM